MSANLLCREFSSPNFSGNASAACGVPARDRASGDWNVYRTRFLVRAKQLTEPLSFVDPLGREHHGVPGDYLVQSSEGLLRIAPREIFEDVYVVLQPELGQRLLTGGNLNVHGPVGDLPA